MSIFFSKFKERTFLFKATVVAVFIAFIINNMIFFIQPFSSESIFKYYTLGYFLWITSVQHIIFKVFPFSFGDVTYIFIFFIFLLLFIKLIASIFKREYDHVVIIIIDSISLYLFIWLLLGTQWNWNYLQPKVEDKMELNSNNYNINELVFFTKHLINETIKTKENSNFTVFKNNRNSIIDISPLGYEIMGRKDKFYTYNNPSIKFSVFSSFLPYLGISGYYNPFTAEAQITRGIPLVQIPFVINHEIAHQLGIASEAEANFIGYLATKNNPLSTIQYSGDINLLLYCLSDLKKQEYEDYDSIVEMIPENIIRDINEITIYWSSYRNEYRKYTDKGYDVFLKANRQKDGLKSYNKVVALAVSYFQKNKRLN